MLFKHAAYVYVVFIPFQRAWVGFIPRGWIPTRMGGNQDVYVVFIPRGWFPTLKC
jgi:hypothetical protein